MSAHMDYIKNTLVPELIGQFDDEIFIDHDIIKSGSLDGFMSAVYRMLLKTEKHDEPKERHLIIKFMKGNSIFRETSKADIQFCNEVFVYDKLMPAFQKILDEAKLTEVRVSDWVPHAYVAKYGYIEGLSVNIHDNGCVLVLDNLNIDGYVPGPRVFLRSSELLGMSHILGQYHGLSYAARLNHPKIWAKLKSDIKPLPFIYDNDAKTEHNNLFRVLYRVAFDRFFEYYDRTFHEESLDVTCENNFKLMEMIEKLRTKYFDEPNRLLEFIRVSINENAEEERFGVILHGDYNRNNVLFRYTNTVPDGDPKVDGVKMLDFQELRFGTPAIDLSFFMYINTSTESRDVIWVEMLRAYHKQMLDTLTSILKANITDEKVLKDIDEIVAKYSYENFVSHFARYAFYGVMICMHFWPWMLCDIDECDQISAAFENDMHGEEFRQLSMTVGGDEVNEQILSALRHACDMGYMDCI